MPYPCWRSCCRSPTGDRYPPLTLTPQKRREKRLQALVAQVEGLAALQPVLLVVEDVYWADPTSLELFDLIVERVAALPLLVIITFRPESRLVGSGSRRRS